MYVSSFESCDGVLEDHRAIGADQHRVIVLAILRRADRGEPELGLQRELAPAMLEADAELDTSGR